MNLHTILNKTIKAVFQTGDFIQKESKRFDLSKIEYKDVNNLVSYVDKEAENQLVKKVHSIFPEAGFITEENPSLQPKEEYNWIIDPLDGTTNFIHGLPIYSISIALAKKDKIILGIVYELNKEECFYAIENEKAFCNKKEIKTSSVPSISGSLLATGFPYYEFDKMDHYLSIFKDLMKQCHGIRRLGSAAVDLAYVACGRFEGYFEYNLNPWDVAAGSLIVQQAGGKVTDFFGKDEYMFGRSIISSNQFIYNSIQDVIQKYWK